MDEAPLCQNIMHAEWNGLFSRIATHLMTFRFAEDTTIRLCAACADSYRGRPDVADLLSVD